MNANVGSLDRALRIGGGLVLVVAAATGVIGAWGLIGVVPLATGLLRYNPVYPLLGINTCGTRRASSSQRGDRLDRLDNWTPAGALCFSGPVLAQRKRSAPGCSYTLIQRASSKEHR